MFFGHFGAGNFGNEATFQAMLWNVRRFVLGARVMCLTASPEQVTAEYGVPAFPLNEIVIKPWNLRNPLAKLLRKLLVGVPSELYRWLKAIKTLWHAHMLIVVGTGLLTDSFCLGGWGPYSVFKWSAAAKFCRCKLCFVSTGAGPLDRPIGRLLTKAALSLADFRSFRDEATLRYLKSIGFRPKGNLVTPDLAFSLPSVELSHDLLGRGRRMVVGLGLMEFGGMYGVEKTTEDQYSAYLETLVGFVRWLLDRECDVRLLTGDLADAPVVQEFKTLLNRRPIPEDRVVAEPVTSTENLLSQIAETDFVVATRFHNVLLSLLLNKPSIAISFHHKCSSLMSQMGLSDYCQDIQTLSGEKLIEQFCQLEKNTASIKDIIAAKAAAYRKVLEDQYVLIFEEWIPAIKQTQAIPDHKLAGENIAELIGTEAPGQKPAVHLKGIEEVVTDKGYHRAAGRW